MKVLLWIINRWNAWEPQPTWQEAARIFIVETAVIFALILILEAIISFSS
jgi:hypothetical protein